jgi:methyltransferase family protein
MYPAPWWRIALPALMMIPCKSVGSYGSPFVVYGTLPPTHYFDWIYVDGDHQYEAVKKGLESYLPKVKPGGFITGDD